MGRPDTGAAGSFHHVFYSRLAFVFVLFRVFFLECAISQIAGNGVPL